MNHVCRAVFSYVWTPFFFVFLLKSLNLGKPLWLFPLQFSFIPFELLTLLVKRHLNGDQGPKQNCFPTSIQPKVQNGSRQIFSLVFSKPNEAKSYSVRYLITKLYVLDFIVRKQKEIRLRQSNFPCLEEAQLSLELDFTSVLSLRVLYGNDLSHCI